jgi:ketol-acid reductoisomerase
MPPADKRVFERVYCAAYTPMLDILSEIYDEVASGNELESVIMAGARMKRFPMVCIDDTPMWKTGEIVRKERGTVPPPAIDPTTAGVYIAGMMAQIDLLLSQGHVYSEVVNESVIEAVDSSIRICIAAAFLIWSTTAHHGASWFAQMGAPFDIS